MDWVYWCIYILAVIGSGTIGWLLVLALRSLSGIMKEKPRSITSRITSLEASVFYIKENMEDLRKDCGAQNYIINEILDQLERRTKSIQTSMQPVSRPVIKVDDISARPPRRKPGPKPKSP